MVNRDGSQQVDSLASGRTSTNYAIIDQRDPTPNDIYYPLGKFWINQKDVRLWYLNSQSNISGILQSTWELISVQSILASISDTSNTPVFASSSGATPPDNIQLVGGPGITVVATPGSNLLTITNTGTSSTETLTGNTGGPISPIAGNINVVGGTTIYVTGTPGTLTEDVVSTNHTLLIGRGPTTPSVPLAVGATNTVLLGNTGADPSFGAVPNGALVNSSVTINGGNNVTVTGGGPLALGGTASINVTGTTQHAVQVGSAAGALTSLALGTAGQILTSNGAGVDPSFQNAAASSVTSVTGTNGVTASPTTGAVVVSGVNATTTTVGVASFNSTEFSVSGAGAVTSNAITVALSGGLTGSSSVNLGGTLTLSGSGATLGIIPDTSTPPGTNPVVPNGSGNITIKGGPLFGTGTTPDAVRTDSIAANAMNIELQLAGANAGSATPNNFGVAQFNSNQFGVTAGYVSSNNFTINTSGSISGGGSITLGGTLNLVGTSTAFPWTDEAVSFNASSNNGYFVTAVATATLPASPAQGDVVKIQSATASVVTITANAGQKIRVGNVASATAGTAKSTKIGDAMELVYRTADTTWYANVSPVGSWGIT